jgi:mRNA-degrading endonuclease YafQ of YafQ-DinJ toxin-antitoxin module
MVAEREALFRENCFHPALKTHKLNGRLKRFWSFSITYSHRILFEFLDTHSVAFIDVGDHSVYQ